MNRLRKYVEQRANGHEARQAYAITITALPDPRPRPQWRKVVPFSAAEEVLSDPALKTVFKAAIERGFAVIPEIGLRPNTDE